MLIFSHKYTDFFTVDDRTKDKDSINGGLIKNGVKNFFKSEMLIWSLFKNISFTTNSYLIFFSVAQILGFLILKLFSIFSNICTIMSPLVSSIYVSFRNDILSIQNPLYSHQLQQCV